MLDAEAIQRLISARLPDASVEVTDLTGGSDHFQAMVVSESFRGKAMLEQHRMVYDALGDAIGGVIHALRLKTAAPRT